jgi:hypothetical protein
VRRLNRSAYTDATHCPCPWRIAWAGQQQMRENVPLLKCNDMRSGPGAIQRELHRPEGGTGMLLSDGNLRYISMALNSETKSIGTTTRIMSMRSAADYWRALES